eukprot:Protomagalhaensia_sp_Gyna_25__5163@NODE_60_length_5841_cov_193_739573_g44_i0_p2_GENE_NODE_60_length_5841_cov_193_739573_g44_i0NODE_60_length_5841_cov_193_739573_g44_i0_p2_ORF_typecomplete_len502_score83_04UNC93/PF05978_16/7e25UNC93/PF05978_16/2_2e03UNC93/PF05978_16/31MFS_1/PF07690_16/6_1e20MFS_1/PF07690_16/5_8e02PUCC/PF03209_15/5_8e02PUCC/PF03209_15/0_0038_NODE_60_length_5841_cov_193_739573_g44_i032984803
MALSDAGVQIAIVGLIALTCPGLFNALNGLGAAGGANPEWANKANTALYACFAVFGYFGGAFFNIFGNRVLLCAGGITYAFYALGMWLAGNYDGAGWVSVLAGVILGIGAGIFWTAQGAMMMAYSTLHNKGKYISTFWVLFNIGGVAGGIIQFAVNYHNEIESANTASYFTFVALMALGSFAVPLVIVSPEKVKKVDGTQVEFTKGNNAIDEIKGALKVVTNKYMLLLTVFFIASNWFYTYQFNFVNGSLFTIRTRGFNAALYWAAQMLAAYVIGILMDAESMSKRSRAVATWAFVTVSFAVTWALTMWVQYGFEGGYDKDWPLAEHGELIDFKDSKRGGLLIFSYVTMGWSDAALQAFAYWIMGAVAGADTGLAARFAGYYKGVQSAGAAVAWGLDLRILYRYQMWIGFIMWGVGTILAYVATRDVVDEPPALARRPSIGLLNNNAEVQVLRSGSKEQKRDEIKKGNSLDLELVNHNNTPDNQLPADKKDSGKLPQVAVH